MTHRHRLSGNALVYGAMVLIGAGIVLFLTLRMRPVEIPTAPLPDVYEPAPTNTVNPDLRSM